jgi:hypothetical protein
LYILSFCRDVLFCKSEPEEYYPACSISKWFLFTPSIWFVFCSKSNLSIVNDSFIFEEAYFEWILCGITSSFERFCFLFVVTCCLAIWKSNSHIHTGTADHELLFVGVYLGSVITLKLDMNPGTINFAIERN